MSKDLALILDECLERIRAGASVQDCLDSFPDHAKELAPLLETLMTVRQLKTLDPPLPEQVAAGRARLLARAAELRRQEAKAQPSPLADWSSRLRQLLDAWVTPRTAASRWAVTAVITLILLVIVGGSAVVAAGTSLPGDPLYPVKRTTQDVRLSLALDETTRAELEQQIQAQRRADALAVAQQRRRVTVDFSGAIESLREDAWVVSGVTLLINSQTVIEGPRQPGLIAQVLALSQGDGTLQAQRIVVMAPSITPTMTSLVSSIVMTETATAAPTSTAFLLPSGTATSPLSVITQRPEAKATATPGPLTVTWEPTVPATVTGQAPTTPAVTARPPTATATTRPATPRFTATPRPATPGPTDTPRPAIPGPTDTPRPATPAPTDTPVPSFTETREPTNTPRPTTPAPTDTPVPSFTEIWEPTATTTDTGNTAPVEPATLSSADSVTRVPTATTLP